MSSPSLSLPSHFRPDDKISHALHHLGTRSVYLLEHCTVCGCGDGRSQKGPHKQCTHLIELDEYPVLACLVTRGLAAILVNALKESGNIAVSSCTTSVHLLPFLNIMYRRCVS